MSRAESVVITGLGLEVPGVRDAASLLDALADPLEPAEFDPAAKLGRKGLRYKDRATKLALCAAQAALADAGLPTAAAEQTSPETLGVVASSNFGNLDTVCRVVETVRAEGADSTSPLDGPNLSSNVVASSIAIRFGCRALNLMLCNGGTSGLDALHLAANAIRRGRALRVLVVGVETTNPAVSRLAGESAATWLGGVKEIRLCDGAGAVVLEAAGAADERGARAYGRVCGYGYAGGESVEQSLRAACDGAPPPDFWLTPNCSYQPTAAAVERALSLWGEAPPALLDMSATLGEAYGALGVLQCIAACLHFGRGHGSAAIASAGAAWGDGDIASLVIRA